MPNHDYKCTKCGQVASSVSEPSSCPDCGEGPMVLMMPQAITVHTNDGIAIIAARRRQVLESGGRDADFDDRMIGEQLALGCAAMALPPTVAQRKNIMPFPHPDSFRIPATKMTIAERIEELATAGEFVAAEIDRLLRLDTKLKQEEEDRPRIITPTGYERDVDLNDGATDDEDSRS